MNNTLYWMWLAEGLGSGCRYAGELLEQAEPAELYEQAHAGAPLPRVITPRAGKKLREVTVEELARRLEVCDELGVKVLTPDSADYPRRLLDLPDMPVVLYATGDTRCLNGEHYVGMVGTRRPTAYGSQACHDISLELAKQGVVIVSGLADGLDGVGHVAAVEAGAKTVAFLGTAIHRTYPAANRSLRAQIEALGGAVLSEYPPDFEGRASGTFLARNRLIAGLSEALCVAEARTKSGTLNTVGHAERYGRRVFAVPGSIYSPTSEGTNELLASGRAAVLRRAGDVVTALGIAARDANPIREAPVQDPDAFTPAARKVLAALGPVPQTPDVLVASTGLPVQSVLAALTELELLDAAVCHPGGRYTAAH